jgi:hypothetical protein
MLNNIIDDHMYEINLSLEKNRNKLSEIQVNRLEEFLEMINDKHTKFTDSYQKTYPNYKAYKMDVIKLEIYNLSDKKKLDLLNNMHLIEKVYDSSSDDENID